ncbi:hypothetical protein EG328_011844 [Venturia inaequalis]|uniref:C2H2-type domain-containing protein n=1 Tax=Venturia inaequalis TaxID=5025 RepID=A0A8H3Z624_VENIN|nr:hypothetical protein EG328_011844 [Venturia inaequalis]KAE9986724.1 hypothetical protein EG327_004176 [Venturia inaequalis]RDI85732.1 hypothetical protein Vi05172_g4455 [Venturia inaequalis]
MVPSHWPVINNIGYESPPPCRSYGPNEDDDLGPEQRAAKRRRIEQNANDYLKGKELYISSAVLKGAFASNSANPWMRKSRDIDAPTLDNSGEELENDEGRRRFLSLEGDFAGGHAQKLKRRIEDIRAMERSRVDTWNDTRLERPTSRASAGYCAEWLQRQTTRSRTPTIDSDEENDRLRRRTSIITTKSPTQRALSRKLARNSSPVKARHAMSPRNDRPSPNRPHSPSIQLHRNRVTRVQQDHSAASRLPESMEVTAGSSTLQHLESPEDRTTTTKQLERHGVDMPPPRHIGFTAINSPTNYDINTIPDSIREEAGHQLSAIEIHKSRYEVLRSAERIARRTVSLGDKGPLAALNKSRHPYIASPAVANGSPGFPYRRVSDGNRLSVSVPVSKEMMIQTTSHSRVQESQAKPSKFELSEKEKFRLEQSRVQHGGAEGGLSEHDHAAGRSNRQNGATKGRAQEHRTEQCPVPIIEPDYVLRNDDPVHEDPMEDVELDDAAPDAPLEIPVGVTSSRSSSENTTVEEVRIVEPSAEAFHINGITANWRCPVTSCSREFNTRGGLASHITRGHKLQVAKSKPPSKPRRKGASKKVKPAGPSDKHRKGQEDVDVSGSIYDPTLKNASKAKQATLHSPAAQLQEPSVAPQSPEPSPPPRQLGPALAVQLPEPSPAPKLSCISPASASPPASLAPQLPELNFEMPDAGNGTNTVPSPGIVSVASPKGDIDIELGAQDANANADEVGHEDYVRSEPDDVVDEDTIIDLSPPPVQHMEGIREKCTKDSVSAKGQTSTVVSGTTVPDHQDSGAYSTFTFNPEQSTQAALLQAQLAFQETQADDQDSDADELNATTPLLEKNSFAAMSKSAYPLGVVTPFREVNNRFSAPTAPTPVFNVLPAATQDLEAAAAGVMFSTVKKPRTKKRISFENWPTTKASKELIAKGPTKGVEWSPFASETPMPQNFYVASPFAMKEADESEVGRSEGLPIEHEHEEITVLEAASSNFVIKTPKPNSFAAPTPQSRLVSFSARTDSFSPRPMEMSLAFSSERKGGQSRSGPSDVPVPSFQEGQGGMLAELNSQDIDAILDDTNHLLGSWDPVQGEKSYLAPASFPAV